MTESKIKPWFASRMPTPSEILAVYGIIAMLIYGWSLYWFIWNLPSWISFLTPGEIWAMYCYTATVNLVETFSILIGIVSLSILLPPKWIHGNFVWYASSIVSLCLIYLMVLLARSVQLSDIPKYAISGLIISVIVYFASVKIRFLRIFVEELAERSTIFLYIIIPLSVAALISLIMRNIY